MDDGMPCIGEVVPPALSFADFGDVFVLTQVSKNWRASLAVAEMEIFLHLLRKYRPILMLFSDRMENIPANAQPSTRWKMLFRLAYELLKSSYLHHSNEPLRLAMIRLDDMPPPIQANQLIIAQGRDRIGNSELLVNIDGTLEFTAYRNMYSPEVNSTASSLATVSFAVYKGTHFRLWNRELFLPLGIAHLDHSTFLVTQTKPRIKRPIPNTAGYMYEWTIEPHVWYPFAHSPEVTVVTHGMALEHEGGGPVKFLLRFDFKIGEESCKNLTKLEILRLFEGIVGRSPVYRRFEPSGADGARIRALFHNGTLNIDTGTLIVDNRPHHPEHLAIYQLIPSLMECSPVRLRENFRIVRKRILDEQGKNLLARGHTS